VIYLQQSKLAEAASAFSGAVKSKPDYAQAHYALGTVLQQQARLDEAIAAFRQALRYSPQAPEVHNNLGTALRQKGDMEAARVEFQEAARLNKKKSDMQAAVFAANTGRARLKEGKLDAAIERFEAAIKLYPDDPKVHYDLARALLQKGQKRAAEAAYQKAKQLDPHLKPLQ
jgi:Flp pilus assembly protein TadD